MYLLCYEAEKRKSGVMLFAWPDRRRPEFSGYVAIKENLKYQDTISLHPPLLIFFPIEGYTQRRCAISAWLSAGHVRTFIVALRRCVTRHIGRTGILYAIPVRNIGIYLGVHKKRNVPPLALLGDTCIPTAPRPFFPSSSSPQASKPPLPMLPRWSMVD